MSPVEWRPRILVAKPRVTIGGRPGWRAFMLTCRYVDHETTTPFATLDAAIFVGRQVAMTCPHITPVPGTTYIAGELQP